MIPTFPNFKKLELTDKEEVEKFTSKFPPYSDFNFTSLWIWDLKEKMGFSILNDNLVVKFTDYLNGQPLLSFLGVNMVNETAKELIIFSENNYKTSALKLVPETIISFLDKKEFDAISDSDSKDYIYSIDHLASMDTWSQSTISKGIRRFIKEYPDYIIKENSIEEISEDKYLEIFKRWSENKSIVNHFELNEYKALKRVFKIKDKNLKIISLYLKDVLVGFSLFEIFANNYAISHFVKADIAYHLSIYSVLNWEEAKILKKKGVKYYNWEQDLGIQGLKKSKMSYHPVNFLKKYKISLIKKSKEYTLFI